MKRINKNTTPPPLLLAYKQKPFASYDDMPADVKKELKEYLLKEQGEICCYCMKRISYKNMKVEHFKCKSRNSDKELEYENLLGACKGNMGSPEHLRHCDTSKDRTDITVNPVDRFHNCEHQIKYSTSGEISSPNSGIDNDLKKTLNLNMQTIVGNRKAVLDLAYNNLKVNHPLGTWTNNILQNEIAKWNQIASGQLKEYCQIVIYYLQKKIKP